MQPAPGRLFSAGCFPSRWRSWLHYHLHGQDVPDERHTVAEGIVRLRIQGFHIVREQGGLGVFGSARLEREISISVSGKERLDT
jgi:hypothetical protein